MNKNLQLRQKNIINHNHPFFIKPKARKVSLFPFQFLLAVVFIFSTTAFAFRDLKNNETQPAVQAQSITRLRVGVYNFKPLIFMAEDGSAQGLYIDVLNQIAGQENWSLEYVPCTFAECLADVESGELDILPSVGYSEERAQKLDFSDEFLFMDWGVVYLNKDQTIETVVDLEGKRVAALKGSIYTQGLNTLLDQFSVRAEIIEKDEYTEVLAAVDSGEADAGIITKVYGLELEDNYANIRQSHIFFSPVKIYFAMPKGGNPAVLETLNKKLTALKADKDSYYHHSLNKWMDFYHKGDRPPLMAVWVLAALAALLIVMFLFTVLLRRQVAARTRSLEMEVQERKQAEEKLLNTQILLQACIESPQGMIIMAIDRQYNYLSFNKTHKASMQYAYGREVEIGINVLESITSDEDREKAKRNYDRAMSGESHSTVEVYGDVDHAYYESFYNPIYNEQREIIGVTAFAMDITARKQAEEALNESESLFHLLIETLPQNIYSKDSKGRFVFANQHYCATQGRPLEDIVGKTDFELHPPEFAEKYLIDDRQVIEMGKTIERIEEHQPIDKEKFFVQVIKTPIHYFKEQKAGILGIFWDITERREAEEALHESQRFLSQLIENNGAIIFAKDREGRYELVNKKWEEALGIKRDFAIGKKDEELFPATTSAVHRQSDIQAMENKCVVETEEISEDAAGNRFYFTVKFPLLDDNDEVKGICGISTDITVSKQAEEKIRQLNVELESRVEERTQELRDAQERLVRHEKLSVLGQMASSIGHELRNPLAVITSAIYYLKLVQPNADEKIKQYLGIIDQEVRNSDKIITDLLDFARIKSVDREAVSVSDLVRQTLERFPVPESVQVILDIPDDLPKLFVDPRQMNQVLGNLTVNACQAISSRFGAAPDCGKLSLRTSMEGDMMRITVKDNGMGISQENIKKLFEPLFTTKTKGIGLGLVVSQKLVEANSGRIEVQSEAGAGSSFSVFLPIYKLVPLTAGDKESK